MFGLIDDFTLWLIHMAYESAFQAINTVEILLAGLYINLYSRGESGSS